MTPVSASLFVEGRPVTLQVRLSGVGDLTLVRAALTLFEGVLAKTRAGVVLTPDEDAELRAALSWLIDLVSDVQPWDLVFDGVRIRRGRNLLTACAAHPVALTTIAVLIMRAALSVPEPRAERVH